jgi:small subunit ribosomal protein S1
VSQISRKRVEDPNEVLKVGQQVQARVTKIEEGGKRIGLSMKDLEPDPWDDALAFLSPNTVMSATVVRLTDFGAFCELAPGVDGLLHVSQMRSGGERVQRPKDVLKVGEKLDLRIVSIDPSQRRIALSRLDERGAVLGSDEAVDSAEIQHMLDSNKGASLGTNLGNLFQQLKKK